MSGQSAKVVPAWQQPYNFSSGNWVPPKPPVIVPKMPPAPPVVLAEVKAELKSDTRDETKSTTTDSGNRASMVLLQLQQPQVLPTMAKGKRVRKDRFGNLIDKRRKHRVTYSDALGKDLAAVVMVESYKEYNVLEEEPKQRCSCYLL